ncbi:hypothetical protein SynNOUM97013_02526 [Synechococcus sp. NOUM97013]|nr:hypothetical protein SynNOUM97013_02526 [Synechococcus sp. NOUM97013]
MINDGELVVELVAAGQSWCADALMCSVFEGTAQGRSGLSRAHKPIPRPERRWIS